jgi:hypothetical protein
MIICTHLCFYTGMVVFWEVELECYSSLPHHALHRATAKNLPGKEIGGRHEGDSFLFFS